MVCTCYMFVGEGLAPRSLKISRLLGEQALIHRAPCVIGGDWGNFPSALDSALPLRILEGALRCDPEAPSYALDSS
eukprot:3905984-Pyramimonas_sp.AAC.1